MIFTHLYTYRGIHIHMFMYRREKEPRSFATQSAIRFLDIPEPHRLAFSSLKRPDIGHPKCEQSPWEGRPAGEEPGPHAGTQGSCS